MNKIKLLLMFMSIIFCLPVLALTFNAVKTYQVNAYFLNYTNIKWDSNYDGHGLYIGPNNLRARMIDNSYGDNTYLSFILGNNSTTTFTVWAFGQDFYKPQLCRFIFSCKNGVVSVSASQIEGSYFTCKTHGDPNSAYFYLTLE